MRKKHLLKLQPDRNAIFRILRSNDHLREMPNGTVVNVMKHLLLEKNFNNKEYQSMLLRERKRYAVEGIDGETVGNDIERAEGN
jgi:hypothetical protein